MDLSCNVTAFRIPERIKMHSEWNEQATLERVSANIYRAGDMGEDPVCFPLNPIPIWGEK